jgi:hypothetical protein
MKVLVTGAAGFIGMHVARRLLDRGDTVVGLDNLNEYYDVNLKLARLKQLEHANFTFHKAVCRRALRSRGAPGGAGRRALLAENPHAYVDATSPASSTSSKAAAIIRSSTSSTPAAPASTAATPAAVFKEHDNVDHPVSLYAATKKANELMAHTYSHLFGCRPPGCASSPSTGPGAGRTWRCSCSPRRSSPASRSTCSTTARCSATSPTSTTSSKASCACWTGKGTAMLGNEAGQSRQFLSGESAALRQGDRREPELRRAESRST